MTEQPETGRRVLLAEVSTYVNSRIHALGRENDASSTASWGFHCECGGGSCHELVPLTLSGYEAARDARRPIVARGHRATSAAEARRWARELRADAEALRRQAEHQHRRALRNLEIAAEMQGADAGGADARSHLTALHDVLESELTSLSNLRDPRVAAVVQAMRMLRAEVSAALESL